MQVMLPPAPAMVYPAWLLRCLLYRPLCCIAMLQVARRLGLPMVGVNIPGASFCCLLLKRAASVGGWCAQLLPPNVCFHTRCTPSQLPDPPARFHLRLQVTSSLLQPTQTWNFWLTLLMVSSCSLLG